MKKWILALVLVGIGVGLVWVFAINKQQIFFLSPAGLGEVNDNRVEMRVVGFLPPWNINKAKIEAKTLDELVFLGIESDENGQLIWDLQSRKINNEVYLDMKQEMKNKGKKNIVGIKLFEDNKIDILLNDPASVDNLVREVEGVVLATVCR